MLFAINNAVGLLRSGVQQLRERHPAMSATKRIKYNLQTLFVPLDRDLQCAVLSMRLNGARRADGKNSLVKVATWLLIPAAWVPLFFCSSGRSRLHSRTERVEDPLEIASSRFTWN